MTTLRRSLLAAGAGIVVLTAAGIALLASPFLPYNVRELVTPERRAVSTFLLVLAFYGTFGAPVAWARRIIAGPEGEGLRWPLYVVANAIAVWLLLRAAAPVEAMWDIVGFPVLGWPWEWELLGRFVALFAAPCVLFTAAAIPWAARDGARVRSRSAPAAAAGSGALLLAASYLVVVPGACTDNLTELMAGGGGPLPALALAGACFAVGLGGSAFAAFAARPSGRSVAPAIVTALLSAPVAFALVLLGTERSVEKYGQTFSALQFLLSPDREHLASGSALLIRYALAHGGLLALIAVAQHPFWLGVLRPPPSTPAHASEGAVPRTPAESDWGGP